MCRYCGIYNYSAKEGMITDFRKGPGLRIGYFLRFFLDLVEGKIPCEDERGSHLPTIFRQLWLDQGTWIAFWHRMKSEHPYHDDVKLFMLDAFQEIRAILAINCVKKDCPNMADGGKLGMCHLCDPHFFKPEI